jgi:hypothetical protein
MRVLTEDDIELQILGSILDAGDLCPNKPPDRYVSGEQFRDCAILNAAGMAVELASDEQLQLPSLHFFAGFLGIG